jgi:hypothetical protein
MALGVTVAGRRVLIPQGRACLHERHRGGLTAVVTHQKHTLAPRPLGELAAHHQIQGGQLLPGGTGHASVVAHDLFCVPIQNQDAINPAKALHLTFVMAIPHHSWGLVGLGLLLVGVRFAWSCT